MPDQERITYGGYVFDDFFRDDDTGYMSSYTCYFHSQALRREEMISPSFDEVPHEGCTCGVAGCSDDAEYYVDMIDYKE